MIYLDHAATTPVRHEVAQAMALGMTENACFANTGSDHALGRQSLALLEKARERFAQLVGAKAEEIIFTSGATESNNLALLGAAGFYGNKGKRIALPKTEHKSVLDPCRQLATRGWTLDWLDTADGGLVTVEAMKQSLQDDSVMASCMLVNNETGVIQNIPALAKLCEQSNVLLHVDAVQALGKLPIHCRRWGVATMSFSAHKLGGPKGVGALFVRRKPAVGLQPLVYGGGQERGLRSGTLPLHQILGLVRAAELAVAEQEQQYRVFAALRLRLRDQLIEALSGLDFNEAPKAQSPHILNVSFQGVDGEALRADLDQLAVSSGSACTSDHAESSYVLRALGRSDSLADASLRFSFGFNTSEQDVDKAAKMVIDSVRRLRQLSPLWSEAA
ncbi:MAG: cysteine desulfurase family protein [Oceanococcus sp.]